MATQIESSATGDAFHPSNGHSPERKEKEARRQRRADPNRGAAAAFLPLAHGDLLRLPLPDESVVSRMENRFNPYVRDAENSQACPETQPWEFPMPGSMDEINQAANSQFIPNDAGKYQMSFQNVMSQTETGFVPNSQVQSNLNRNDSVLEIPRPKPRKGSKGKKVSQRGKGFSKEEDRVICSAFLNVSKDPVTGANQSSGRYYQRMHDYFHENIGTQSSRSAIAIRHRWLSIQKAVNKFCGFFSTIERLDESGHNEQSRINQAVDLYEESDAWTFAHCWDILRHEPKWNDKMLEINTHGNATRVNQLLADDSVGDRVVDGNTNNTARPEGRDTAKKRKARPNADTSASSAAIEVLSAMNARCQAKDDKEDTQMAQILQRKDAKIELQQNMIALQREEMQKRWELEKEKLSLNREEVELRKEHTKVEQLKAEAHFMGQDLDKLAPHLREYYMTIQREIMERHGIRTNTGSSSSG